MAADAARLPAMLRAAPLAEPREDCALSLQLRSSAIWSQRAAR